MGLRDALGDVLGGGDTPDDERGEREAAGTDGGAGTESAPPATDPTTAGPAVAAVIGDGPADFEAEAEDFRSFWPALDYSAASLPRLDEIAAAEAERADHLRATLPDGEPVAFSPIATGTACYAGEVFVRTYDEASWVRVGEAGWAVAVEGPEGTARVDVFGGAHACLEAESAFAAIHDAVLESTGVDGETAAEGGGDGDTD